MAQGQAPNPHTAGQGGAWRRDGQLPEVVMFVEASPHTPAVFDLVEKPLHQISSPAKICAEAQDLCRIVLRSDIGPGASLVNQVSDPIVWPTEATTIRFCAFCGQPNLGTGTDRGRRDRSRCVFVS